MSPTHLGKASGTPWRYQCVHCDSHAVVRLTGKERDQSATYVVGGKGKYDARADAGKRFRCLVCEERARQVWDKREDAAVRTVP